MKKVFPFVCATSYSILGGLQAVCALNVFSMLMSPFYNGEHPRFFACCVAAAILLALLIVGIFLLNIVWFPELKSKRMIKGFVVGELLLSIVLFLPCFALWNCLINFLFYL